MNQIYQICIAVDKQFKDEQEDLNQRKLKLLNERFKLYNIPLTQNIPGFPADHDGFTSSDDYCLAISFLDSLTKSLWLSKHPKSFKGD
jgi:hypothetical protein